MQCYCKILITFYVFRVIFPCFVRDQSLPNDQNYNAVATRLRDGRNGEITALVFRLPMSTMRIYVFGFSSFAYTSLFITMHYLIHHNYITQSRKKKKRETALRIIIHYFNFITKKKNSNEYC